MAKEDVVEEKKQESPSPEGKKEVPDDRPEKNWQAELNRKVSEREEVIENLQKEISNLKENQSAKELEEQKKQLEEKFYDMGYDKEVADVIDNRVQQQINAARREMKKEFEQSTKPLKKQVYNSSKERYLSEIKQTDSTGLVSEHYGTIEQVVNELDPSVWSDRKSMENAVSMVLGDIMRKNPDSIKTGKKADAPTEDKPKPKSSKGKKKAKKSTIDKYKEEYGVDEDKAAGAAAASDELDKVFYEQDEL